MGVSMTRYYRIVEGPFLRKMLMVNLDSQNHDMTSILNCKMIEARSKKWTTCQIFSAIVDICVC